MTYMAYFSYHSPIGIITIASSDDAITGVSLGKTIFKGEFHPTSETNRAATQLQEYLSGKRSSFDIALQYEGTPFQKNVWRVTQAIPYGEIWDYARLAQELGESNSQRAAGVALQKNPMPILIPAHRVVTAKGKPHGTGDLLKINQFLIDLENSHK